MNDDIAAAAFNMLVLNFAIKSFFSDLNSMYVDDYEMTLWEVLSKYW